jgi:hypothetical protein
MVRDDAERQQEELDEDIHLLGVLGSEEKSLTTKIRARLEKMYGDGDGDDASGGAKEGAITAPGSAAGGVDGGGKESGSGQSSEGDSESAELLAEEVEQDLSADELVGLELAIGMSGLESGASAESDNSDEDEASGGAFEPSGAPYPLPLPRRRQVV